MTESQLLASGILVTTLGLFAWGRLRHDIVAGIAAGSCALAGLIPFNSLFAGFSHPAVITVAAVLIISEALRRSGLVNWVAERIVSLTENLTMHLIVLTGAVTIASAFMNNVGALALFLPIALVSASHHKRSPAILLMPLAFGSILGGMTTSIGTPPNIIISNLRADYGNSNFSFFDFTPVGGLIALTGVVFMTLIGWRLIPRARLENNPPQKLFSIDEYLLEIEIPEGSNIIGKKLSELTEFTEVFEPVGLYRYGTVRPIQNRNSLIQDDILIVRGDIEQLNSIADQFAIRLYKERKAVLSEGESEKESKQVLTKEPLAEGVIQQGSWLIGLKVTSLSSITASSLSIIALARQGKLINQRLRDQFF